MQFPLIFHQVFEEKLQEEKKKLAEKQKAVLPLTLLHFLLACNLFFRGRCFLDRAFLGTS